MWLLFAWYVILPWSPKIGFLFCVLIVEEEWFDWKSYLLDGEEEEILGLPVQYDQVLTLIYQFCLLFLEEFPWSKQTWYS